MLSSIAAVRPVTVLAGDTSYSIVRSGRRDFGRVVGNPYLTGLWKVSPLSDRNDEKGVATRQELFLTTLFRAIFDARHCGQRCAVGSRCKSLVP